MRKGGEPWWLSLGWHLFGLGGGGPLRSCAQCAPRKGGLPLVHSLKGGPVGGDFLALPTPALREGPGPGAGTWSPQQAPELGPYQHPGHPAATDETELWACGLGPPTCLLESGCPPQATVTRQCYTVLVQWEETHRNLG